MLTQALGLSCPIQPIPIGSPGSQVRFFTSLLLKNLQLEMPGMKPGTFCMQRACLSFNYFPIPQTVSNTATP